jgi:hypothetical protein
MGDRQRRLSAVNMHPSVRNAAGKANLIRLHTANQFAADRNGLKQPTPNKNILNL